MLKKNLKKLFAFGMAAALGIGSLTACGGSDAVSDSGSAPAAENDAAEPITEASGSENAEGADPYGKYDDTIVLTAGRYTQADPKLPDGDSYEDNAYTRYLKERLNVQIEDEFEATQDEYDRQTSLAIAAGEIPDILTVRTEDVLQELVDAGLVADLTEVYEEYASDGLKEIYSSYGENAFDSVTFDGKLMALPGTFYDIAPQVVFIRQDWLDKLNMTVDEDADGCLTLSELEEIAKAFVENDPGESGNPVGFAMDANALNCTEYGASCHTMTGIASAFDCYPEIWYRDADGNVVYGSTTEGMKETLAFLNDWFEKGLLDPQVATRTYDDIAALLANNQLGITTGPYHFPGWGLANVKTMNPEADFACYTICDNEGNVNVFRMNFIQRYVVVSSECKNPEAVVKVMNVLYDELAFGDLESIAPEVYEYVKLGVDNSVKPTWIECMDASKLLSDYAMNMAALNGETEIESLPTPSQQNTVANAKNYLANPEEATVAEWISYTGGIKGVSLLNQLTQENKMVRTEPIFWGTTDTMKKKWANLEALEAESFIKIITGAESIDYFDTFVANWLSQGGQEIIDEIDALTK